MTEPSVEIHEETLDYIFDAVVVNALTFNVSFLVVICFLLTWYFSGVFVQIVELLTEYG